MPIWIEGKPRYDGAVLRDTAIQAWPLEDIDFYVIVWDDVKGHPDEVWVGTNAHGGGHRFSIDATAEVRSKYSAWCKLTGSASIQDQQRQAAQEEKKKREQTALQRQREEAEAKRVADEERRRIDQEHQRLVQARRSAGNCIRCGQPLSRFDKLLERDAHRRC